MFGGTATVNEEQAGDAVEVCLAMLFFTTLYPHEFKMCGDPYDNYAGFERSLRSFEMLASFQLPGHRGAAWLQNCPMRSRRSPKDFQWS